MSKVERWELIGLDLRRLLRDAPEADLRAAVAAAASLAVERAGLDQDLVSGALAMLRAGQVDPVVRQRLTDLADQLDEAGFAVQESIKSGHADNSKYQRLFSQARAASALSAAMDHDARTAAMEGIYETYHATDGDDEAISEAIHTALRR